MKSAAFLDYSGRFQEAIELVRLSGEQADAVRSAAAAKGAAVLVTAALERFLNDVLFQACRRISAETWGELSEGQRRYLARQIGVRLNSVVEDAANAEWLVAEQGRLRDMVDTATKAFVEPKSWEHHTEYGLFGSAPQEFARLNRRLKMYSSDGGELVDKIRENGWDVGSISTALEALVSARHAAAHGIQGAVAPSTLDVKTWAVSSFWLARAIERFLWIAIP